MISACNKFLPLPCDSLSWKISFFRTTFYCVTTIPAIARACWVTRGLRFCGTGLKSWAFSPVSAFYSWWLRRSYFWPRPAFYAADAKPWRSSPVLSTGAPTPGHRRPGASKTTSATKMRTWECKCWPRRLINLTLFFYSSISRVTIDLFHLLLLGLDHGEKSGCLCEIRNLYIFAVIIGNHYCN